jgi:hypothetical protein
MEPEARSGGADALALAMEPNGAQQPPKKPAKSDRATSTVDISKARRAQARARDPAMDHAAQPAFGYRPWGNYQARSNNWGWDNYRAWDNYRPGGNYQGGGSRQTFSGYQSRH